MSQFETTASRKPASASVRHAVAAPATGSKTSAARNAGRTPGIEVGAGGFQEDAGAVTPQESERGVVPPLVRARPVVGDLGAECRRHVREAKIKPRAASASCNDGTGSRSVTSVPYASIVTASTVIGA